MKFIVESANVLTNWSGFLEPVVWKGFVILAFVFAMMTLWRRSAAAVRHLAWTMAFVCLLCLPVLVRCLPVWNAPMWIVPAALNNKLPDSLSFILENQPGSESKAPPAASGSQPGTPPSSDISRQTAPVNYVVKWSDIAVVVWFAGIMIGLTRLLAVQIRLERMAGRMRACENQEWLELIDEQRIEYHIRRQVKLLVSEISASPMTWGFWRPIIALPAESREWPEERLHVVLRHELAHVKRWDCLTHEIASVVCALYWFNPLTWLAAGRMRAEREKACDDFVLNAGAHPSEYAGHLVEIARQFASANWRGAVAMARPSGLEQRVTAILDGRCNRGRITIISAVVIVLTILGFGLLIGGCSKKTSTKRNSSDHAVVSAQLRTFAVEKEKQEDKLIAADEKEFAGHPNHENYKLLRPDCGPFFAAAAKGSWPEVDRLWLELRKHTFGLGITNDASATNGGYPHGMWLQTVREAHGAFEAFAVGDEKYSKLFGDDVIHSIPAGSVYFGGTDHGRFIVTAMQKSQVNGDPFFTLTQNALADGTYLDYLRSMYGNKIFIPTAGDSGKCFQEYMKDVVKRKEENKLKPGENVQVDATSGRVAISGQVAVMQINGLLVKTIFDKEPDREFYIEESWPLDWMYPYLEPHGLIFKLNRQPLTDLSSEIVQRDHDYWTKTIQPMIGDWLGDDTSVQAVAAFARKVFLERDFSSFVGDPRFVQNDYSCRMFSKERASIADLYVWRMNHAANDGEKERMAREADFAYRQALALCPYNPEAGKGYIDFLKSRNRDSDAALVNEMAGQFPKMK
jgi:beta-lactamase regulating signal transducer with metallopeptidase domain